MGETEIIGYRKIDLSTPMEQLTWKVTGLSLLLLVVPLGLYLPLHFNRIDFKALVQWPYLFLLIGLIVVHELIHAVTWKLAGGIPWSAISFGFSWKGMAPYAHAKAPMPVEPYRLGGAAPGVLLGVLPWLISLFTGDFTLAAFGVLMLLGAAGDFFVLWGLRRIPAGAKVLDHPTNAGCFAFIPD